MYFIEICKVDAKQFLVIPIIILKEKEEKR